jgi:elongation factor P--(R)-beta-lysine ligase
VSGRGEDWRPGVSNERLRARAALLQRTREFFAARGVLEVDTPLLVNAAVSDVHLHSARVRLAAEPGAATAAAERAPTLFLHTSPEYAMKRLLAAGSGDIYQICHVVRGLERGRLHNPEFTLIEWYRVGFTLGELIDEVDALVRALLGTAAAARRSERMSYRDAFRRELGLDPLTADEAVLAQAARSLGFERAPPQPPARGEPRAPADPHTPDERAAGAGRDAWLELLMAAHVGPRLGHRALTFVHDYPASQAALARLDPTDERVAQRFELYCEGIELANGFHELAVAAEQRHRFERDNAERRRRGLPVSDLDERLLAALGAGLPDCVGVALGFDRTLMIATGAAHIEEVLPFPTSRA